MCTSQLGFPQEHICLLRNGKEEKKKAKILAHLGKYSGKMLLAALV